MTGLVAQVASYHCTMLELTELLRATHSFTDVCKTVCVPRCFFYTPVAIEVIGTPDFNCLDG